MAHLNAHQMVHQSPHHTYFNKARSRDSYKNRVSNNAREKSLAKLELETLTKLEKRL